MAFLMPREEKFFDLFDQAAEILVAASERFLEMLSAFDRLPERAENLKEAEHSCDLVVEQIIKALALPVLSRASEPPRPMPLSHLPRLPHQWPVGEPLPGCRADRSPGALAIGFLAAIPAERKLAHIAVQVLRAHVMERTEKAALQQAVVTLRKVSMDDHGADELLVVIDRMVAMKIVV